MADNLENPVDETIDPPTDIIPSEGEETPPPSGDYAFNINAMIASQLEAFQSTFINQINEDYSAKLKELQKDKDKLEKTKTKLAIIEELKAAGLDSGLIDFVYDDDQEVAKLKIEQIKKLINSGIEKGIEEKLKLSSYIPPTSSSVDERKSKPKYFL